MKTGAEIREAVLSNGVALDNIWRLLVVDGNVGFIEDAHRAAVIGQAVEQEGISVAQDELQNAVNMYRRLRALHRARETHAWLESSSLTVADLGRRVGGAIVRARLKQRVAAGQVDAYFEENPHQFEFATISQIVVPHPDVAEELRDHLGQHSADFRHLAREHSMDQATRWNGGFVGVVRRADLNPEAASAIFAGSDGEIVGPVETDQGYHLIAIEHIYEVGLDSLVRAVIKNLLFDGWLHAKVAEVRAAGAVAAPMSEFPPIEVGDLDPADDQEIPSQRGIFEDSTSVIPLLSVTDTEVTVTLHRTPHLGAGASVPDLLANMYEPLFDPLRAFPCCGQPEPDCPHIRGRLGGVSRQFALS